DLPSSSLLSLATQPTGARRKQARSSRQQTRHLSEQRVGRQPRRQHIEALVEAYLQSQIGGNRSPKTIEWHRTSLTLLRRFLQQQRGVTEIEAVEAEDISAWFTYLRTTRGSHGRQRRERTVQTYARSARAFFHWLERRRLLEENVFDLVPFPRAGRPLIETLTDEEFERLLAACAPPRKTGRLAKRATARNRAILWVLYDTGIRLSELLTLCLDKVDRRRGVITVWGKGAKERRVALGENCQIDDPAGGGQTPQSLSGAKDVQVRRNQLLSRCCIQTSDGLAHILAQELAVRVEGLPQPLRRGFLVGEAVTEDVL
ncbi:tyrosine-type recombinase/integrase, partial [Thermogemmatispora tikiterensis]|uniref:tyrosine-type recombinase/integrase n=1 Tax=Thermogemmatispora tikiterensis TaxID=1825093 RepID=UPI001CB8E1F9